MSEPLSYTAASIQLTYETGATVNAKQYALESAKKIIWVGVILAKYTRSYQIG